MVLHCRTSKLLLSVLSHYPNIVVFEAMQYSHNEKFLPSMFPISIRSFPILKISEKGNHMLEIDLQKLLFICVVGVIGETFTILALYVIDGHFGITHFSYQKICLTR